MPYPALRGFDMICAFLRAMCALGRGNGYPEMIEKKRIGLREVRAIPEEGIVYDDAIPGFAARRQKGSAVTYVLRYRTAEGRQRWHTIGRHGAPWTPDEAREEARRILGEVAKGNDPAAAREEKRKTLTVAELCARYLADAEAGRLLVRGGRPKRPLTLESDRGRIEGHIVPLLGRMAVKSVTRRDVERFMHAVAAGESARTRKGKPRGVSNVRGGRGVATRTIGLLGAIFTYAIEHGIRDDNPAHRVRKFAENKRERRLTEAEYGDLGRALRAAAGTIWPPAVACLRFLALTGWRSGEALALRWQDIDLSRRVAVLPETKTGRSVRPLSRPACDLLASLPRLGDARLVFPPTRGDGLMTGFKGFARRILALGTLPRDITPHILRHSFASIAADLGHSELAIASLLGHRLGSVTSRYTHAADAVLLAAADAVARRILDLMGEAEPAGEVVPLRA